MAKTSVPRKGDCGGQPRVGNKGDVKPGRGGRGRGRGRGRNKQLLLKGKVQNE